jgi:hypothetical protein
MTPPFHIDPSDPRPGADAAVVSPDGRWVAWTGHGAGADVYVAPTDSSSPAICVVPAVEASQLLGWCRDGRSVLVQQQIHEARSTRLSRVAVDQPGILAPLVEKPRDEEIQGAQIHPNGVWMIYGAKLGVAQAAAGTSASLVRHDIVTGEIRSLAKPSKASLGRFELHPQGTQILYSHGEPYRAGRQVWLVDIDGQSDREILNLGPSVKLSASWVPDGVRVLAFVQTGSVKHIGIWEARSGRLSWLLDQPRSLLQEVWMPPLGDEAVLLEASATGLRASLLSIDSGEEHRLPELPGSLSPIAPLGGRLWIGLWSTPATLPQLVRFSLDDVRPEGFEALVPNAQLSLPLAPDLVPPLQRAKRLDRTELRPSV